jgi:hypothetical protein
MSNGRHGRESQSAFDAKRRAYRTPIGRRHAYGVRGIPPLNRTRAVCGLARVPCADSHASHVRSRTRAVCESSADPSASCQPCRLRVSNRTGWESATVPVGSQQPYRLGVSNRTGWESATVPVGSLRAGRTESRVRHAQRLPPTVANSYPCAIGRTAILFTR